MSPQREIGAPALIEFSQSSQDPVGNPLPLDTPRLTAANLFAHRKDTSLEGLAFSGSWMQSLEPGSKDINQLLAVP